jgi:MFS family permease
MPDENLPMAPPPVTPSFPQLSPQSQPIGGITRGFRALRVRNFRLFWISQVISLTGTWMQTTAQAWLVLKLTNSALAIGLVTTFQFLPVMIFALYGGVLADRLPKRRTIIITQSIALIQAVIFGILVATGTVQLWHVYALAVIQGFVTAVDNPVRQAFIAEMVGREDLVNAVALNSMSFNAARILGPAVAGIVIARINIAPTLFLNALSFIPVIIALLMMDSGALYAIEQTVQGSTMQKLREGLSYAWHTRSVLLVLIVSAAVGTFGFNFTVVLPLIGGFILNVNAEGFGALSAFLGVGALLAAITTAYVRHVTMRRLLISATAFGLVFALLALSTSFLLSAILLVALGFSAITFSTSSNTLLQLVVPDGLRGRVLSLQVLLFVGSTPIGAFLIGAMSHVLGVGAALMTCAVLCLAGTGIAFIYQQRSRSPGLR